MFSEHEQGGGRRRAVTGAGGFKEEAKKKAAEAPHLQLLHLACPTAAFLTVDAADGQR